MLVRIGKELFRRKPDWLCVYGDTNSTLAGALAAAKLHVSVAHVEVGLRSFNKKMPEEINRILTDHVSTLLLCPTRLAVQNLANEGITEGVHHVGDVMYDAALTFGAIAGRESAILKRLNLTSKRYILATVHRAENTDAPERLRGIMETLRQLAKSEPVILPVHPRTRGRLKEYGLELTKTEANRESGLLMIDPVSYLDMVQLEKHAREILTDSCGVQKEAYFHGVPGVTLRDETEWVEAVEAGWNRGTGTDIQTILHAEENARPGSRIDEYGDGRAAALVVDFFY